MYSEPTISHTSASAGPAIRPLPDEPQPLTVSLLHAALQKFAWLPGPPVVLCIGTDRIPGDCLGPLVGTMLCRTAGAEMPVYGTLDQTVHALNLPEISAQIKKKHPGQPVIAVDASLGDIEMTGTVLLRPGSLCPGSGVNKVLPLAGDLSITGIVNTETCHPYLDLQTTRLSTVYAMAEYIVSCLTAVSF
jgi:putative sporulation protein YyaC